MKKLINAGCVLILYIAINCFHFGTFVAFSKPIDKQIAPDSLNIDDSVSARSTDDINIVLGLADGK